MIINHKKNEFDDLLKKLELHAEKEGLHINPDKKIVENIIKALIERKKTYGEYYCPCRLVSHNTKDNHAIVCPCATHKNDIARKGQCNCHLFIKQLRGGN